MKRITHATLLLLITFTLALLCANIFAQAVATQSPKAKAQTRETRRPGRNKAARPDPPDSKVKARPLPDGAPKGTGDGLQVKADGTITGNVAFVSVSAEGKPVPVNDDMEIAITKELAYVEKIWYEQASEIYACGQKLKFKPVLKPSFIDSYQSIVNTNNLNIVYIFSDCTTVEDVQPCNPMGELGQDAWGYYYRSANWWTNEVEPRRGKGVLPAFTFAMIDPILPSQQEHEKGRWGRAFAHEFGHALGLWDTHLDINPDYEDTGLMAYNGGTDILPGYVAEILTRVFECRVDITASFVKTSTLPSEQGKNSWDFTGKISHRWGGVLTSNWVYFNGWEMESSRNRCNTLNRFEKLRKYHSCDADKSSETSDEIDLLPLSAPRTPGLPVTDTNFAWQWEDITSTIVENKFLDESGKCGPSVTAKATTAKLNLLLASDGQKAWLVKVSGYSDSTFSAADPEPEKGPDCGAYTPTSSLEGERIEASTPSSASELTAESKLKQGNSVVGTFNVTVKMALTKKGGP